jgi:hypothetical protein
MRTMNNRRRGNPHHPGQVHVEADQHQGGHGHAYTECDRFAGAAGGLKDVVFQNGGALHQPGGTEDPEKGDSQHGHRDAGRHRQADL